MATCAPTRGRAGPPWESDWWEFDVFSADTLRDLASELLAQLVLRVLVWAAWNFFARVGTLLFTRHALPLYPSRSAAPPPHAERHADGHACRWGGHAGGHPRH